MPRLFFLLSGEHPTLPKSELKSILYAEGFKYKVLEELDQAIRIDCSLECLRPIASRASMTRNCCLELFTCKAEYETILQMAEEIPTDQIFEPPDSMMVRVRRVKASSPDLSRLKLERDLGATLLKGTRDVKVDLKNPRKTFLGVITGRRFLFGLSLAELSPTPFMRRNPMKRPFFHPTALPAKMARCMVNLAAPRKGDLLVDFFCGTGSILIEAGLIGCRVVGLDASRRMVEGALKNLKHYGVKPEGLILADSHYIPISRLNCIATDPPYGRSSTTFGRRPIEIVKSFLRTVKEILPKGGRLCIAFPQEFSLGRLGIEYGFKHVESHFVYVHGSLTREIAVLEAD